MGKMDAKRITEKWARKTTQATPDMIAGIDAVTENPAEKAIKKLDKAATNYVAAIESGKTARGLGKVTLDGWKKDMKDKGVPRVAAGVAGATGKYEDFQTQFIPHLEAGQAKVAAMDDSTFEANIQRAITMMRHNKEFKRT